MPRHYYRPVGLVYGPDASAMMAAHQAVSLGGHDRIAFSHLEVITRNNSAISRSLKNWRELDKKILHPLTEKRVPVAGLDPQRTAVMGIINVTPDSFSDGGKFYGNPLAIAQGEKLIAEGADLLDVGGESTRPGAEPVSAAEEMLRVIPVISGLAAQGFCVSVDTRKAIVMAQAATSGARLLNDVSALEHDKGSLRVAAHCGLPVILMHAQGDPRTMQDNPSYDDVVLDVYDHLEKRIAIALAAGVLRHNIIIDPGIGFGKSFAHNLTLLRHLSLFHGLGVQLLVGLSRKGFIGALTGETIAEQRVHGSVSGATNAALQGVQILRVHDVKATRQALQVMQGILSADGDKP